MKPTLGGNDAELGLKKRPKTNKLDKKYNPTLSNYQAYYAQICLRWSISSVNSCGMAQMANTKLRQNATKVTFAA